MEHLQLHVGIVQQAYKVGILQRVNGAVLHGIPALRLQHNVAGALLAHDGGAGGDQIGAGRSQRQGFQLCMCKLNAVLALRCSRDNAGQPKAGNEGVDLQLLQKAHSLSLAAFAHLVRTLGGVNGRIGADGAQRVAQLGHFAAFEKVLPLLGLDALVVDVLVHTLQRTEVLHQRQSGLFTDAPHARDIIGGVAHQALDLNELLGFDAVFFADGIHIHGHSLAAAQHGGGQQYGGGVAYQLQAVAVSRGKEAVIPPGGTGGGQRAKDIIRFPAFGGDGAVAKVCQQLLEHRHLLGQLLGHTVAGGFVAIVHFVAEGRSLEVKGHGHLVRLALLEQREQDIQKAKNGVGVPSVLGGQQLDAKKGAVGNAVAVNDQ